VIVIGGGLAGLSTAIDLGRSGVDVLLVEKDPYPRHKVCGEYISNEVLPYLKKLGFDPFAHNARQISRLQLSHVGGKLIDAPLPLGGFGISRYALDHILYEIAKKHSTITQQKVNSIQRNDDYFKISTREGKTYIAPVVAGAFGKRSNLDIALKRRFVRHRTPWMAVKGHYEYDHPDHVVALHQFSGGYCGLSNTESGSVNACYLASRNEFKKYRGIDSFQRQLVSQNPNLLKFYNTAKPLFRNPLTISQISFERKPVVDKGIFMIGDSAGLIHPLCGNGMAMAFRAASIFSELYLDFRNNKRSLKELESRYISKWNRNFRSRLRVGGLIQKVLLSKTASGLVSGFLNSFPSTLPFLIRQTHGKPF